MGLGPVPERAEADFAGWYRLRGLGRVGLLRLVDLSTEAGSSVRLTRARGSAQKTYTASILTVLLLSRLGASQEGLGPRLGLRQKSPPTVK